MERRPDPIAMSGMFTLPIARGHSCGPSCDLSQARAISLVRGKSVQHPIKRSKTLHFNRSSWFPTGYVKKLRLVGEHSHSGKVVSLNETSRCVESLPTNEHAETAQALVRIMEQVSALSLHRHTHIQTRRTREVRPLSTVSMPLDTFTCAAQMAR